MAGTKTLPDFLEVTNTFAAVAGGGGIDTASVDITNLSLGIAYCKIFEVHADSASLNFDVEVYEDPTFARVNRIIQTLAINTHNVLRIGDPGAQYRDRTPLFLPTSQARFHIRVVNAGLVNDITVLVRWLPYYAQ